jgi:DNA-3-methyladenine glycosylase
MSKIIERDFFTQSAESLALALLGKIVCRKCTKKGTSDFNVKYRITATEAYPAGDDATDGADSQKLEGGHIYVTKKGMHGYCRFDVVANREGIAEGVLISGVDCYDGPGLAADALDVDVDLDGVDLLTSDEIWLEDDGVVTEINPPAGREIGVTRDDKTKEKPLRFSVKQFIFSLV